jgi:hypothetical protein
VALAVLLGFRLWWAWRHQLVSLFSRLQPGSRW